MNLYPRFPARHLASAVQKHEVQPGGTRHLVVILAVSQEEREEVDIVSRQLTGKNLALGVEATEYVAVEGRHEIVEVMGWD